MHMHRAASTVWAVKAYKSGELRVEVHVDALPSLNPAITDP